MLAERRAGDDEEASFRQACDGEITFDAAAFIQALCIYNRSNGLINTVGANIVQEFQRPGAAHFQLIERSFIEQTRILTCREMLVSDGPRPVMTRPAFRLMPMSRFLFIKVEPIRPFP